MEQFVAEAAIWPNHLYSEHVSKEAREGRGEKSEIARRRFQREKERAFSPFFPCLVAVSADRGEKSKVERKQVNLEESG